MDYTYGLEISFIDQPLLSKEAVIDWLVGQGIENFVEGIVDNLDIDHDYASERDFYDELGGDLTPLAIYSFSATELSDIKSRLIERFGRLSIKSSQVATSSWRDGWKESFHPIETPSVVILPPWVDASAYTPKPIVVIDPGMAFGTGQHATTQLCLLALAALPAQSLVLDVGCGSGILGIAAAKLGAKKVVACDIEIDAILATESNAKVNKVTINAFQGSVPLQGTDKESQFPLIFANILFIVLEQIIGDLALHLTPQGHLLLSGLLVEQKEVMLGKCHENGLKLTAEYESEGWVCLVVSK